MILESKISETEKRVINNPQNKQSLTTSVNNAKNDLNQLIEFKAEGAAIRSRSRWVKYGEKHTKYFLGLEKWLSNKKTIKSLKNARGKIIEDEQEILTELVNYFHSLCSNKQVVDEN